MAISIKDPVKDHILIYCRIRPLENLHDRLCISTNDEKTVVLFPPDASQNERSKKEIHYSFQHIFNAGTYQKELFDHVAYPLVQDLLQGIDGLLCTYGTTSSGKTYTMTGDPDDCGILPRCLDAIFNSIKEYQAPKFVFKPNKQNGFIVQSTVEALLDQQKELGIFKHSPKSNRKESIGEWSRRVSEFTSVEDVSSDMNYSVFISYVEIYNNYIYDLLQDVAVGTKRKSCHSKMLREDSAHNMYVFGVVENEVETTEEAMELFYKGQQRRKFSNTDLNTEPSRSHNVFTIRVVQAPLDSQGAEVLQDKDQIIISQLSLIDLAGSERPTRSRKTGQKLSEAGNMNGSLLSLRTCIEASRKSQIQGTSKMIPYRDSKLTHLFKTFFEGQGKIRMVVCVNPRADDYDETARFMKIAEVTQSKCRLTLVSATKKPSMETGLKKDIFREAIRKAREQGVPITEVLVPNVYGLGSEFSQQLSIPTFDDESAYRDLLESLLIRRTRRNAMQKDLNRQNEAFRKNLVQIDEENIKLKQDKDILLMDLQAREGQICKLECQLSSAAETVDVLENEVIEFQHRLQIVDVEMYEKERIISDQAKEIDKIKTKMQAKLDAEKDRLKRTMARRLAAKQAEIERKMCFTDEKFRQLREILNADDWECLGDVAPLVPPKPRSATSNSISEQSEPKRRSSGVSFLSRAFKSKHATAYSGSGSNGCSSTHQSNQNPGGNDDPFFAKENETPRSCSSKMCSNQLESEKKSVSSFCKNLSILSIKKRPKTKVLKPQHPKPESNHSSKSLGDAVQCFRKGSLLMCSTVKKAINYPVETIRRGRSRSKSSDVWLEHIPIENLDLNMVHQLKINKKRSVKKLKAKDVTKNVSKYVLQHQEQDSQGALVTELHMANIIPSAGGGAQVVFNDVEKIQKPFPHVYKFRKRNCDSLPLREVEKRCRVSIECHGLRSKIMKKK